MSDASPSLVAPRRRWYQFSLGTMFVAMTIVAIWLGWELRGVRQRQADLAILEMVSRTDGAALEMDIMNSQVILRTSGIQEVSEQGLAVVPSLVRIMESDKTSFDGFVRCYAACQMILDQERPGQNLLWYGGASVEKLGNGEFQMAPHSQEDLSKFKAEVVADVKQKLLSAR